jgi:hypothetical protein
MLFVHGTTGTAEENVWSFAKARYDAEQFAYRGTGAVRVVWIVASILLVVGLGAWATTCTGERPRPTGDTIPGGDAVTTTVPATATTLAG